MLRGSIRLGSLAGVPVYLHWTFLVLVAWFMAGPLLAGGVDATGAALRTAAFVIAIFGCVVLHELGHALAARRFGIGTRDITLLPIGGVARLERMPENPVQELFVALAGPAVNVVIAGVIVPGVLLVEGPSAFVARTGAEGGATAIHEMHFLASLASVNIFLVVFNMIPAFPMDGGRVLRALLAMVTDRAKATAIAAGAGQVVAVGFALVGIFSGHLLLVVIAAFVFLSAGAEAQSEQFKAALQGLPAKAAMLTRFHVLRATQTLRDAATELLAGSQQDFPVLVDGAADIEPGRIDAGSLVGVLTRSDLLRALAAGRVEATVGEVMNPSCPTVGEDDDLRELITSGRDGASGDGSGGGWCPVVAVTRADASSPSGRVIVGLVTPENVTELVMLRGATVRPG